MMNELLPQLGQLLAHPLTAYDGRQGSNRETQHTCQIPAQNDFEAVQCWLREYEHKPHTHRAYHKEVERLILWCVFARQKPLSSLDRGDFEAYFAFLANPEPRELWCNEKSGRGNARHQAGWRPFQGPLSLAARAATITIIQSLMNYLMKARYLAFNPLLLMRQKLGTARETEKKIKALERILEIEEWQAMLEALDKRPEATSRQKDEKERLRCIVALLYFLGIRVQELETHTWSAFRIIQGDCWFFVKGKGDKMARIPVNSLLLDAIARYRTHLQLPPFPAEDETLPLIANWNTNKPLSRVSINLFLKGLAIEAAERFADQPVRVAKLQQFSAHWIRHFSATMQDRVGIAFHHIKANHRHERDETTRRYIHSLDKERHAAMDKLTWF